MNVVPSRSKPVKELTVPLAELKPSPTNPRKKFDDKELQDLAASIAQHGVLQRLIVRVFSGKNSGYEIVAGERRFRAAKKAGLKEVPVAVWDLTDDEVLDIQAVENEQRADVTPIERATHYDRMRKAGRSIEQIAAQVGRSVSTVREALRVLLAPAALREAMEGGHAHGVVPLATAQLVCKVPDAALRERVALHVLHGLSHFSDRPEKNSNLRILSSRETKSLIQNYCMRELKGAPFDRKALDLVKGVGDCDSCIYLAGNRQKADPDDCEGIRADTCTNPSCFTAKAQAAAALTVSAAKAAGRTVLDAKTCKEIFRWGGNSIYGDWVDLDARPFLTGDKSPRDKLAGKLAEVENEIVIAIDPDSRSHDLIPEKTYRRLIKAEADPKFKQQRAAELARRKAESEQRDRVAVRVLRQLYEAIMPLFSRLASDPKRSALLNRLIEDAAENSFNSKAKLTAVGEWFGVKTDDLDDIPGNLCRRAWNDKDFTDQARLSLLVLSLVDDGVTGVTSPRRFILLKGLGIDVKAIEKEVQVEMDEETKAAVKPSVNGHAKKPKVKAAAGAARLVKPDAPPLKVPRPAEPPTSTQGQFHAAAKKRAVDPGFKANDQAGRRGRGITSIIFGPKVMTALNKAKIGTVGQLADALAAGHDLGLDQAKRDEIAKQVKEFLES